MKFTKANVRFILTRVLNPFSMGFAVASHLHDFYEAVRVPDSRPMPSWMRIAWTTVWFRESHMKMYGYSGKQASAPALRYPYIDADLRRIDLIPWWVLGSISVYTVQVRVVSMLNGEPQVFVLRRSFREYVEALKFFNGLARPELLWSMRDRASDLPPAPEPTPEPAAVRITVTPSE